MLFSQLCPVWHTPFTLIMSNIIEPVIFHIWTFHYLIDISRMCVSIPVKVISALWNVCGKFHLTAEHRHFADDSFKRIFLNENAWFSIKISLQFLSVITWYKRWNWDKRTKKRNSRWTDIVQNRPNSKVHGANMGPTWVLSAPGGPHVGPMNLAIRALSLQFRSVSLLMYRCLWKRFTHTHTQPHNHNHNHTTTTTHTITHTHTTPLHNDENESMHGIWHEWNLQQQNDTCKTSISWTFNIQIPLIAIWN